MKKVMCVLLLPLVVVSGLVFANRENDIETAKRPAPKPLSVAEKEEAMKQWLTTPGGIQYQKWEASPAGKKVYASEAKIRRHTREFTPTEAVVTSLFLPPGSRLGFGVMVSIEGEAYILSFGAEQAKEFEALRRLKVADKIVVRSRHVSHAPKYAYAIVAGDHVERGSKLIYKRAPRKGGC